MKLESFLLKIIFLFQRINKQQNLVTQLLYQLYNLKIGLKFTMITKQLLRYMKLKLKPKSRNILT
jgi:hypothetical protein